MATEGSLSMKLRAEKLQEKCRSDLRGLGDLSVGTKEVQARAQQMSELKANFRSESEGCTRQEEVERVCASL